MRHTRYQFSESLSIYQCGKKCTAVKSSKRKYCEWLKCHSTCRKMTEVPSVVKKALIPKFQQFMMCQAKKPAREFQNSE